MIWLLDGNALVAMALPGHVFFDRTHRWLAGLPITDIIATCPLTEGTLLRLHMQQAQDKSPGAAWHTLRRIHAHPRHTFWPENFSYTEIDPLRLTGHRQITDSWLAELARRQGGKLATLDAASRVPLRKVRPLLGHLDSMTESSLERLLLIERSIWECVNRERYRIYQHEWKEFYRRWQRDAVGEWPTAETFEIQHHRLLEAVADFRLPPAPLAPEPVRETIYQDGIVRTAALTAATPDEIQRVAMPLETILP